MEIVIDPAIQTAIDETKIRLLNEALESSLSQGAKTEPVRFEVAGIIGEFVFSGTGALATADFLKRYMTPFPVKSKGPAHFRIEYTTARSEYADVQNPIWYELSYEHRVYPKSDGTSLVIHRNFSALVDKRGQTIYATGPCLADGFTDTIDNLTVFVSSLHLPKVSAIPLHAATVERDGYAYVFFGASGAGKSTLARQSYELDGLRVLSGDQIYLKQDGTKVWAHANATTIPEFPRSHPGWCAGPKPVKAIIHLVQRPEGWTFKRLELAQILPLFFKETIYVLDHVKPDILLNSAVSILNAPGIVSAELSYSKGISFWSNLLEQIEF